MALPKKAGEWRLGRDFQRKQLQGALQQDIRPDILTNHVRYSERIDSMMPKAKYLTIIRDPAQGSTDKNRSKNYSNLQTKYQSRNLAVHVSLIQSNNLFLLFTIIIKPQAFSNHYQGLRKD